VELIVVGEILVEMIATEVGQSLRSPGLFSGPYPSGAPAIFADQAARVGCGVALVGSVGDDPFGSLNIDRLKSSGVDIRAIQVINERPTGTAFVAYKPDGSRDFIFNIASSAAGLIHPSQLDPEMFRDCRIFHVMGSSLISPQVSDVIRRGMALARDSGAQLSFDPNVRKELLRDPNVADALQQILSVTDIFLPSEADLHYLYPQVTEDEAIGNLLRRGVRMVVLKRGAGGSTYFDRDQRIDIGPIKVQEVDPTGAGDCFGGTFLSCLLQHLPPERALELANAAGTLAVLVRGPMEGNSTMDQLQAFLSEHHK
jgi:tagatose kinase